MTNGQFVSRVIGGLKVLNRDSHISKRYVLEIGIDKSKTYISQKLLDKSLFKEDNLFRTISCLNLREAESTTCGVHEFYKCSDLMKSEKSIPALIYSRYGSSIISVMSIDGEVLFTPTTLKNYSLYKQRRDSNKIKNNFYYIKDGFLYLPDSEVEVVSVTYIPYDESDIPEVSSCDHTSQCKSIWDFEFIVPDKLSEQVILETINEVRASLGVPKDENPNGDENIKSSTTR